VNTANYETEQTYLLNLVFFNTLRTLMVEPNIDVQ